MLHRLFLMFVNLVFMVFISPILSILVHRDKRIVLFGAWMGDKFADNSRYLFQYLHVNKDKYNLKKVIWVTRNKEVKEQLSNVGYEVYMVNSLLGIYYHLKSKTHIICNFKGNTTKYKGDINGLLSLGANKIQLWHGIPIKGVGKTSTNNLKILSSQNLKSKIIQYLISNKIFNRYLYSAGGWDRYKLVTTGKEASIRCLDIIGLPSVKAIECGYPRNCEVIELFNDESNIIESVLKNKFSILYLPTFRDVNSDYVHPLESKELIKFIEDNDIVWIEKAHSVDNNYEKQKSLSNNYISLKSNFDINVLLPHINLLLSDYSSVIYDVLYWDKPIILYIPDYEIYKNNDRGFVVDLFTEVPGRKVEHLEDLVLEINNVVNDSFFTNEIIEDYRKQFKLIYDDKKTSYENIWKSLTDTED